VECGLDLREGDDGAVGTTATEDRILGLVTAVTLPQNALDIPELALGLESWGDSDGVMEDPENSLSATTHSTSRMKECSQTERFMSLGVALAAVEQVLLDIF
jgi:hypothetical protein